MAMTEARTPIEAGSDDGTINTPLEDLFKEHIFAKILESRRLAGQEPDGEQIEGIRRRVDEIVAQHGAELGRPALRIVVKNEN